MGRKPSPKASAERSAEKARYRKRNAARGIVKVAARVPAERVAELRAITPGLRADAKPLLDADRPSADRILQIHAICRSNDLDLRDLPVGRPLALPARESRIGQSPIRRPKVPQPPAC